MPRLQAGGQNLLKPVGKDRVMSCAHAKEIKKKLGREIHTGVGLLLKEKWIEIIGGRVNAHVLRLKTGFWI